MVCRIPVWDPILSSGAGLAKEWSGLVVGGLSSVLAVLARAVSSSAVKSVVVSSIVIVIRARRAAPNSIRRGAATAAGTLYLSEGS